MSNGNHVRPGEIISSGLINQILDRLEALENNLPGSENGNPTGPIIIDGFQPPLTQEVGRVLTILGSNLPFPLDENTVTIADVPVPLSNLRIAPSNRERIELVVPDIGPVPSGGRNAFVRIFGTNNSTQRLYRFLPTSGGPPTPSISGIRPQGGSIGETAEMNSVIIIEGENFSSDPENNSITFTPLGFQPEAEPYPRPGSPPLEVAGSSPTEIRVLIPDMSEITVQMAAVRVRVEIAVNGASDPANFEFFTFRP